MTEPEAPDPAYGVFDTLLVRDGAPVDLAAHLDRLTRSVQELYDVPVEVGALGRRIVADAGGLGTARVRTSFTPGSDWEIAATPVEVPELEPSTLVTRRVRGGLGRHKWADRRLVADPGECDDVLLLDKHDLVLECGRANVFVVSDGACITPPLDGRILPGTVRTRALARLRADGRPVVERAVALTELAGAAEVFTTSSIRGVQPVVGCLGVGSWPVGPVTTWLRARLDVPARQRGDCQPPGNP